MNVLSRLGAYLFRTPGTDGGCVHQCASPRQYRLTELPPLRSEWDSESVAVICDGRTKRFHWLTDTAMSLEVIRRHNINTGAMRIYTPADLRKMLPCGVQREQYMRDNGWVDSGEGES